MKRQNIRTLSLVVITLTYLIIGGAVFDYLESSNEIIENTLFVNKIEQFKKIHNMNDAEFERLWHKILEKKPSQAGYQWKFIGSLYFCTVAVTLIGYGHSTPRTVAGKFFCIFYTLIGIPISLIMFQSVGERLNSLIVFLLTKLKKRLKLNIQVTIVELITIEVFFSVTITLLASYIFMTNEEWSYFDSLYYCFITLTTIGFGDMVPMQKNNTLSKNLPYACFNILFIFIGLTTLASSLNLLVLRLATLDAEEQVQKKREQAEALRQAVRLEGDVINSLNGRLDFLTPQEKPENEHEAETLSVCSCACMDYQFCRNKTRKKKFLIFSPKGKNSNDRKESITTIHNLMEKNKNKKLNYGNNIGSYVNEKKRKTRLFSIFWRNPTRPTAISKYDKNKKKQVENSIISKNIQNIDQFEMMNYYSLNIKKSCSITSENEKNNFKNITSKNKDQSDSSPGLMLLNQINYKTNNNNLIVNFRNNSI